MSRAAARRPVVSAEPRRSPAEAIIDAVAELVSTRGWSATTMSDVAAAAGVSRQTVYNEFGTRQDLVQAYVVREIETLVAAVETQVRAHADDAHAALSGAFGLLLRLASHEPLVRVIVADAEGGQLIRILTSTGLAVATERVGALIEQVWPQVGRHDARLIAESLARLAISHAIVPTAGPEASAAAVARLVGPFIDMVLSHA